ncbi:MAG TPA: D-alanyl-D-alanine carboxypeptidase family protein [Bacteroidetes bacterium]|nr:D-alanyl-D-alanine carboxypeptidase family protein [Bacteroidota bacterium]
MKYTLIFLLILSAISCNDTNSEPPANGIAKKTKSVTQKEKPLIAEKQNYIDTLPGVIKKEYTLEYLMGRFDPGKHPDFVSVDAKYSDGDPYMLRKETYESFKKMWQAAKDDGIDLKIISATRNFYRQKSIWEAKWTGARKIENGANAAKKYPDPKTRALKILEYSSMPGTSRHHWGSDIDINDLDNSTFEHGKGKAVYEWLVKNAIRFGFCQPYSAKGTERPFGYNEEKWHWSYLPIAQQLTEMAKTNLKDEMIGGFKGAEAAVSIGVVEKYVLGINKDCLP